MESLVEFKPGKQNSSPIINKNILIDLIISFFIIPSSCARSHFQRWFNARRVHNSSTLLSTPVTNAWLRTPPFCHLPFHHRYHWSRRLQFQFQTTFVSFQVLPLFLHMQTQSTFKTCRDHPHKKTYHHQKVSHVANEKKEKRNWSILTRQRNLRAGTKFFRQRNNRITTRFT